MPSMQRVKFCQAPLHLRPYIKGPVDHCVARGSKKNGPALSGWGTGVQGRLNFEINVRQSERESLFRYGQPESSVILNYIINFPIIHCLRLDLCDVIFLQRRGSSSSLFFLNDISSLSF